MMSNSSLEQTTSAPSDLGYPPIERSEGIPEFKLLVLGLRGAGKTVFVSALYNQLKQLNDSLFIITTDDATRKYLLETYDKVKGIDKPWPSGTIVTTRYKFSAFYQTGRIRVFDFNYLDFPGSFVGGDSGGQDFDIQKEVENTHSLVILIDGLSILRHIKQMYVDGPGLYDEIDSMTDLLYRCAMRPIQFAITKFDILNGLTRRGEGCFNGE